jgi:hypothetical protein
VPERVALRDEGLIKLHCTCCTAALALRRYVRAPMQLKTEDRAELACVLLLEWL